MTHILPRFYARSEEADRQRAIAQIVREADVHDETIVTAAGATLPGDRRRLRGIPVVGGVTGTSPGTDPLAATLKAEADRERNRAA